MKEYIGLDIGGTKIAIVKGDENGRVLQKIKFANDAPCRTILERVFDAIEELGSAEAIGISCGGPLDSRQGIIQSPPNLPGWDDIPIVRLLRERTGMPAFLQNDADACALAEWRFGAGQGSQSMVFLTFGTGLGAGLILNGALYSGAFGCAGEIGHVRMEPHGPIGYGKEGSLEGFCSGGGLKQLAVRRAQELLDEGKQPSFCPSYERLASVTAQSVAEAAFAGDAEAIAIYRQCGDMLGRGIAILLDLLNPEKIVIGSIYARAQALLEESMRESILREALPKNAAACEILPAALGESLGDIAALSVAITGIQKGDTRHG